MEAKRESAEALPRCLSPNPDRNVQPRSTSFPTTETRIFSGGHSEIAESSPNVPAEKSDPNVGYVKINPSHSGPLVAEAKPFEKCRCQENPHEASFASTSTAVPTSPTPSEAEGRRNPEDSPVSGAAFFPIPRRILEAKINKAKKKRYALYRKYHNSALLEEDGTFRCPKCSYNARNRFCVAQHIFTHTREKPFECWRCNHRCARLPDLERHIKRHHLDEKFYSCNRCPFSTIINNHLDKHAWKHHKAKERMFPLQKYFPKDERN